MRDRAATERCGVLLGGAPELVRLDEVRPAVYRVAWSLSSAASGRLRRRTPGLGNHAGDVPCRAPGGPAQGGRAVRPPTRSRNAPDLTASRQLIDGVAAGLICIRNKSENRRNGVRAGGKTRVCINIEPW